MFEKQKLTQIQRYTTNKDGSPLTFQKDGKTIPYTRVLLKSDRYANELISGFGNKDNEHWKVGDEVEIKVERVAKDGKIYFNFSTPKKDDIVNARIDKLEKRIKDLEEYLKEEIEKETKGYNYPKETLTPNFDPKEIEYPDADQDAIAEFMKD